MVIVSGPSGVGKSTICKKVVEKLANACLSVSVTTRPKADCEVDGQNYWFLTRKQFQQRIDDGLLLEYAEVFGNLYGTPRDKTELALQAGKTVILEIDIQGGGQVRRIYPDAETIFILPPTEKALEKRINLRGRESGKTAQQRLGKADSETAAARQCYEHMIVNDNYSRGCQLCQRGTWLCIFLTYLCNTDCAFCPAPYKEDRIISPFGDDPDIILDYISRYKQFEGVSFSGGECFLVFERLYDWLSFFKKRIPDMYYWVYTNGVAVNNNKLEWLKRAGLDEIRFNIAATGYNSPHVLENISQAARIIENVANSLITT